MDLDSYIQDNTYDIPESFGGDATRLRELLRNQLTMIRTILSHLQANGSSHDTSCPDKLMPQDLTVSQLTFCVQLSANCCRLHICSTGRAGYELIEPVYIPEEDRNTCTQLYDICTEELKQRNRMYMPDPIERSAPDRNRLLLLMRQYISGQSDKAAAEQLKGKQFNRLFGSRG